MGGEGSLGSLRTVQRLEGVQVLPQGNVLMAHGRIPDANRGFVIHRP